MKPATVGIHKRDISEVVFVSWVHNDMKSVMLESIAFLLQRFLH